MFQYELEGKKVILALTPEFIPSVASFGIQGTPLYATVHAQEPGGLWIETQSFVLCPVGVPKVYDARGTARCRAHIFIPASAVVSLVVFPGAPADGLEEDPAVHKIGFNPEIGPRGPG